MASQTEVEYKFIIDKCRSLFEKKTIDYGTAWRIMRLPSITDQIFIKAQRIRSIQEKGKQLIEEDVNAEFIGIINYCVIALIQLFLEEGAALELEPEFVIRRYNEEVQATMDLFLMKNHDYGEAWREMRVSSITDIILMKIHRTKQIEDNGGKTLVSEGLDANYRDMLNYAVFALIRSGYTKAHV
ncbi:MAG: DUF1599 domain-containing protein [Opitutaceae bacterium]|nr:DUF1599 domain-containing protein [Cytophagales bacterium]